MGLLGHQLLQHLQASGRLLLVSKYFHLILASIDSDILVACIELGDINIDSCTSRGIINADVDRPTTNILSLQGMDKDGGLLFRRMLRNFGAVIGWKHGSMLVDALLSDFYEKSLEHLGSLDHFQEDFFHQNIGGVVVSIEVSSGELFDDDT